MSDLLTIDQLAERFGITVEQVQKYRRRRQWPCVKFGRNEVRFTPEHVEQIIAMQTAVAPIAPPRIAGQTARSQSRSA